MIDFDRLLDPARQERTAMLAGVDTIASHLNPRQMRKILTELEAAMKGASDLPHAKEGLKEVYLAIQEMKCVKYGDDGESDLDE